ncbi:MAG: molybdopterin-dependent oxidoreductase [Vulcanimicrobiaceae bacterium]
MSSSDTQAHLVHLTIDGVAVAVPKGTLLVEAAKTVKQEIPVYCYHPKLGPAGLCRVCLVEVEGIPKLQIGCNTPVADGMVVHTQNAKVDSGRSMILELLLVNHPLDCPICDKGGECDLQDYAMAYGRGSSDVADAKTSKPKGVDLGPTIVLDEERCVVCQRCVRFDDIIVRENQLVLKDRGARDIIATATGEPYRHNFTGNVTEICPVGALTSKTYRFKSRPWDLNRTQTSCTQCAVGCRQLVDVRLGTALRTMSVEDDDAISDGWLCDRGRYNIGFYTAGDRITQPLYRKDGEFHQIGWDDAFTLWAKAIQSSIGTHGVRSVGAIGGGRLTNEEAYLLQYVFRSLNVQNLDWRAGAQRQGSPGAPGGTYVELERAGAIVIAGESPAERAPVMDLRIRKAVARHGATLIRIAPIEAKPNVASVDVATVAQALAALPPDVKSVALVWDGVNLELGAQLAKACAGIGGLRTYITGEQGNARGAEAMGMLPRDGGLDGEAMFAAARDGQLGVLSLFGVNPVLNAPDGVAARQALERVPFLVVSDLFMTETAQLATLVLPAKGAYEKSGTTTGLAGDVLPINRSLQAPESVLSDLEMLIGLAQQFDLALPTSEQLDATVIALCANAATDFAFGDARFASGASRGAPQSSDGLDVAVQRAIFSGGGTSAHDERIATLRPLPQVALGTQDAKLYGLQTGDYVDLESNGRELHDVLVALRPGIAAGTAVLIGGLPDDPANVLGTNARVRVVNVRKTASPVGV